MQVLENLAPFLLTMVGIFLAIQLPFALLTFVTALRERHRRAVYVLVDESEALPPNAYMDLTNAMAEQHGFAYQGVCRAGNTALYKMRYDSWVSPDRQVFAVVGAGSMIRVLQSQATWLTSKLIDGRVLITVDTPGGLSSDLSGMTESKLVTNADFTELLAKHRARVEAEMTPVEPYDEHDPLGDHVELIGQRADRMERAGYVYFLDDGHEEWRYTTWGAMVRVLDSYKRIFVQMARNHGRKSMSRPGDSGYVPSHQVKTRSWLRYVEFGLWITMIVIIRLWSDRPAVLPRQAAFRALMLLATFLGLAAIWFSRWWISRKTVDPRIRKRRRLTFVAAGCLLCGGCYMISPDREPFDEVNDCKVLVGGGRVYVVVDTAHGEVLTSRLARFLQQAKRPGLRRVVSWIPTVYILESDGLSAHSTQLPTKELPGELMPVGQHLYVIDPLGEDDNDIAQWSDGKLVPVPAEERQKIQDALAEDLATQCTAQGWEYTELAPNRLDRLARTIHLGDRQVVVDITLVPVKPNSSHVLLAKIEVPGAESLVRVFPPGREDVP